MQKDLKVSVWPQIRLAVNDNVTDNRACLPISNLLIRNLVVLGAKIQETKHRVNKKYKEIY